MRDGIVGPITVTVLQSASSRALVCTFGQADERPQGCKHRQCMTRNDKEPL